MHHTQFVTDCCLHYAIQDGSVSVAGVDAHVKPEQVKGLNSSASIAAHQLNNLFEFQPMGPGFSAAAFVLFTCVGRGQITEFALEDTLVMLFSFNQTLFMIPFNYIYSLH